MIVPIGHEKAVRQFPWVTVTLILLNTTIFFLSIPLLIHQVKRMEELQKEKILIEQNPKTPYYTREPEDPYSEEDPYHERLKEIENRLQEAEANLIYNKFGYIPSNFRWYTLFTSLFLHSGLLHLIGNLWFLYLIGASIEDLWGRRYFLCVYLAAGVTACLLHGAIYRGSEIPVVGASGAIAGLMGAFMVRNFKVKIKFFYFFLVFIYPLYGTFYLPAYVALGGWFAMQLISGTISLGYAAGVAYWAHIGGFLFGVAVAVIFKTQKIEEKYIAPKLEERLEAVKLHPKLIQAFRARDRGDLEGASKLLRELVLIEPNNMDAHIELVNIYISTRDLEKAGIEYDKIMDILSRDKKADSLIENYKDIVQLDLVGQLSPQNKFRIAVILSERGMFEEAVNLYRALIRNHPDSELVPLSIFRCAKIFLHRLNKPNLAHAAFQYILEKYPDIEWKDEVLAELSSHSIVG